MSDEYALPTPGQADAAAHQAMASVAAHAEQACQAFRESVVVYVIAYLLEHGDTPVEQLSIACKNVGIVPHDDRGFGPTYKKMYHAGIIEVAGYTTQQRGHNRTGGRIVRLAPGWTGVDLAPVMAVAPKPKKKKVKPEPDVIG